MPLQPSFTDYCWLVSTAAEPWLRRVSEHTGSLVQLTSALREELTAAQTHLVLEMVELRRRARVKFAQADQMFFTSQGLEQSSGERIAEYKSRRFHLEVSAADFCCGVGGDLLSIARRCPVIAVDRCPIATLIARTNCQVAGVLAATVLERAVSLDLLANVGQWHVDPDRRVASRRTTRIEQYDPGRELLNVLLNANRNAAVKLAPAANVPLEWRDAELEWISDGRECKQLVAWFGKLAKHDGLCAATCIDKAGVATTLTGHPDAPIPTAVRLGDFIYEPDAAVMASGLVGAMAHSAGLESVSPLCGYLTGPWCGADPLRLGFRVIEILPFDIKHLRALLRAKNIGRLTIKKRGVDLDPGQLVKKLSPTGDEEATLLVMPRAGKTFAVLADRVETDRAADLNQKTGDKN